MASKMTFLSFSGVLQIFSAVLRILQRPEDRRRAEVQATFVLPHGRHWHFRLQPDACDPHVSVQYMRGCVPVQSHTSQTRWSQIHCRVKKLDVCRDIF